MSALLAQRAALFAVIPLMAVAQADTQEPPGSDRVRDAVLKARDDVEAAAEALNELRGGIALERSPLASRLEALQAEVQSLRAEAARVRRLRQQGERERAALVAEADAVEDNCRFLLSILSEYRRSLGTRIHEAESAFLAAQLASADQGLSAEEEYSRLPAAAGELLALSADRGARGLGGTAFDGTALDEDGVEQKGRFAVLGPVAYFAAADGGPAGLAITRFGNVQPSIYDDLGKAAHSRIADLVKGEEATVPIDVTSGDAMKVAQAGQSFGEQVRKGGFVMVPLLLVGLLAAILAVWKVVDLSRVQVSTGPAFGRALAQLEAGDTGSARETAQSLGEPLASLVVKGIEHRSAPREHLEEIMHEHVLSAVPRLERHLGTLAVLGGIAPLLGLLGTVTGMIHTFELVTIFGSGDAKLLSGGISEALVTTEFGLAIAIPVLLAHAFLARRARSVVGMLEQTATGLVNELKSRANGP